MLKGEKDITLIAACIILCRKHSQATFLI